MVRKPQKELLLKVICMTVMAFLGVTITVRAQLASPVQPEYTGFESINTTDMVNLSTGDFTYSMPLVHVPSPEGGFSMPLSYHAGISPNEPASWVGLGWSLNPGAIARSVNGFADDFNGANREETFVNAGGYGWAKNFIVGSRTYDSEQGYGGSIGLMGISIGWGTQEGVNIGGVLSYDAEGFHVDPVGLSSNLLDAGFYISMATGNYGISMAMNSASTGMNAYNVSNAIKTTIQNNGTKNVNNLWTIKTKDRFFKSKYEYYMNATVHTKMYGSLYLQDAGTLPTNESSERAPFVYIDGVNNGMPDQYANNLVVSIATDMHMLNDGDEYAYVLQPTSISNDIYNVMGNGISGNIEPYRKDVGSLARQSFRAYDYLKYCLVPFVDDAVEFKYTNELANYYEHHKDETGNEFGADLDQITQTYNGTQYNNWPTCSFVDDQLCKSSDRIESDRDGLYNGQLAKNKQVTYYTNEEIDYDFFISSDLNEYKGFFLDFCNATERNNFRRPDGSNTLNPDAIGGFAITNSDGTTYHYALPVYNTYEKSHSVNGDDGNSSSTLIVEEDYVITWLLTAITGSDFVDRGEIGCVDEEDFGYWVVFDYGKYSDNHGWRNPIKGTSYSPEDINHKSFSEGKMEVYYLDEIRTRTHTAVFVKDERLENEVDHDVEVSYPQDADRHLLELVDKVGGPSLQHNLYARLELSDIYLLRNEDWEEVKKSKGAPYLNKATGTSTATLPEGTVNMGNLDNVWDIYDLADNTYKNALLEYQYSHTHFNYSFDLCQGTPTITGTGGKLTLESIETYKKDGFKPMPDFVFDYGDYTDTDLNPDFGAELWDGWGMYSAIGAEDLTSHQATSSGDQWCLRKITTPTGGEISVEYERDVYNSIAGYDAVPSSSDVIIENDHLTFNNNILRHNLTAGQSLTITAIFDIQVGCQGSSTGPITIPVTITSVDGNVINFSPDLGEVTECSGGDPCACVLMNILDDFENQKIVYPTGTKVDKSGGDIRVKSIAVSDEQGISNITRYVYTASGNPDSYNSGACAIEPGFSKDQYNPIYDQVKLINLPDYPQTPVMYSNVCVYEGRDEEGNYTQLNQYQKKTMYEFVTPHVDMVELSIEPGDNTNKTFTINNHNNIEETAHSKYLSYIVNINTSQIGVPKYIKEYNNKNQCFSEEEFEYITQGNEHFGKLGKYTKGTILSEAIRDNWNEYYFRYFRTVKNYFPTIIKSITRTSNGISSTVENTEYDLLTGNVLKTEYESSMGDKFRTISVPAYTINAYRGTLGGDATNCGMGPMSENPYNKQMLTQEAENHLEYWDNTANNWVKLAVGIQSWNNKWYYREYDNTAGYTDNYVTDVWRKHKNFVWSGDINSDGTYNMGNYTDFNWTYTDLDDNSSNNWKKTSEVTHYSHYSMPVEAWSLGNNYSATKTSSGEDYVIASTSNAKYTEFAYSGCEDEVLDLNGYYYTGGEVCINDGWPVPDYYHTGTQSLLVDAGEEGFGFIVDAVSGKKYKVSVWVKNTSKDDLIFSHTGNATTEIDRTEEFQGKDWTLITQVFKATYTGNITFYCENNGAGAIFLDDFRIHPFNGAMTSYVSDNRGNTTAILDANNIATVYEYDDADRLTGIYKETPGGFVKVQEYEYNFATFPE